MLNRYFPFHYKSHSCYCWLTMTRTLVHRVLMPFTAKLPCVSLLLALVSLAHAVPNPQLIDLDGVAAAKPPVFVKVPLDVVSNTPTLLATTTVAPITTDAPGSRKRSQGIKRRDGACSPQPSGAGPVPSPDTASAFLADPVFQVGGSVLLRMMRPQALQLVTGNGYQCSHTLWLRTSILQSSGLFERVKLHGPLHSGRIRHLSMSIQV